MRRVEVRFSIFALLLSLSCGQVKRETNEIHFKVQGTLALSGGPEEGGCGGPAGQGRGGFYMMEPTRKYEVTYRAWTDADGRTWLDGGNAGCTLEVASLDVLKTTDTPCIIAKGSVMDVWGIYETVYSYLEVDLEAGTFRAKERSRVIAAGNEARETCSIVEGSVEELP